MSIVISIKSLEDRVKELKSNYNGMLSQEGFLDLVKLVGIKLIGRVDTQLIEDKAFVKKLIQTDPYSLFYLPSTFHNEEYFKEVSKNHEILLINPLNKKLSLSIINGLINNCPDYVRFDYFKKPFEQLQEDTATTLLKQKIGIGFLIKGLKVPNYLETDMLNFQGKSVEDLIQIKTSLLNYEKIEELLSKQTQDKKRIKI